RGTGHHAQGADRPARDPPRDRPERLREGGIDARGPPTQDPGAARGDRLLPRHHLAGGRQFRAPGAGSQGDEGQGGARVPREPGAGAGHAARQPGARGRGLQPRGRPGRRNRHVHARATRRRRRGQLVAVFVPVLPDVRAGSRIAGLVHTREGEHRGTLAYQVGREHRAKLRVAGGEPELAKARDGSWGRATSERRNQGQCSGANRTWTAGWTRYSCRIRRSTATSCFPAAATWTGWLKAAFRRISTATRRCRSPRTAAWKAASRSPTCCSTAWSRATSSRASTWNWGRRRGSLVTCITI